MTVERRVLCGVVGAVLVFSVLFKNHHDHTASTRGFTLNVLLPWPEPYNTVAGYSVSAIAFYLIGAGVIGGRLRSRHWVTFLIAAHVLAALLVVGMAAYWEFIPPPPGDWCVD